jgi:hypothetical protein
MHRYFSFSQIFEAEQKGTPLDLEKIGVSESGFKKINECSCGCGGELAMCGAKKEDRAENYMFFENLKTIQRAIEQMMQLSEEEVDMILKSGHNWAADHIATSKDDIQEVMEFLVNQKKSTDHTQHNHNLTILPFNLQ